MLFSGDSAQKIALAEQASTLANNISATRERLVNLQQRLNDELKVAVDEVNRLGEQIAQINKKIAEYFDGLQVDLIHISQAFAVDNKSPQIEPVHIFRALLHKSALAQFDAASLASDDMDREAVMTLAKTFTPQEVQLYYQIALNARADMNLAPDEYAGFTMALLRMLAFKPAGSVSVKLPERFKPEATKAPQEPQSVLEPVALASADKEKPVEQTASTPTQPQVEHDPAPWEDAPVGESDSGSTVKAAAREEKPSVKPVETKPVAVQGDDDVPYVDSYDEYASQMEPTIDDYGFAEPVQELPEEESQAGQENFESRYDFAEDYDQIPEFTEIGRKWFEKLRYTYPATYARDILERSECVSIEDDLITLRIDPLYENRLKNQKAMLLVQRIVDPLFGRRMRFKFELETPRSRTISQERARLKKEQKEAEEAEKRKNKYVTITDDAERKAAIESLKKTPLARTVMRRFNARIDPMSVKKKIS